MKKSLGVLCAFASAFIFGFTPVLGKLSYAGGSNGVTLTFLRALIALPVLYLLIRANGQTLRLSREQARHILLIGILGPAATTLLLYSSYEYLPVGISTVLHFMYPVLVSLAEMLFFHEKATPAKLTALGLCTAGVVFFLESGSVRPLGIVLALLSGVTYTYYMLGVERSSLRSLHHFKLSFYFCLIGLLVSGVFGACTKTLRFQLSAEAWLFSALVSLFVSVGAITFFQLAITRIGAAPTAILSTLEPICSVLMGLLFLHESLSPAKLAGCGLILAGVVIATRAQLRKKEAAAN